MARPRGYRADYENAFRDFLRLHEVLHLGVSETHRQRYQGKSIKNFDFVVSSFAGKFLVDIKGKEFGRRKWDNWIRDDDLSGLKEWSTHFVGFTALLVVPYLVSRTFNDPKLVDEYAYHGNKYYFVALELQKYYTNAIPRAKKFMSEHGKAIHIPAKKFHELCRPLSDFIPELRSPWMKEANHLDS